MVGKMVHATWPSLCLWFGEKQKTIHQTVISVQQTYQGLVLSPKIWWYIPIYHHEWDLFHTVTSYLYQNDQIMWPQMKITLMLMNFIHHTSANYDDIVSDLLKSCKTIVCNMYLETHFLNSQPKSAGRLFTGPSREMLHRQKTAKNQPVTFYISKEAMLLYRNSCLLKYNCMSLESPVW